VNREAIAPSRASKQQEPHARAAETAVFGEGRRVRRRRGAPGPRGRCGRTAYRPRLKTINAAPTPSPRNKLPKFVATLRAPIKVCVEDAAPGPQVVAVWGRRRPKS